MIMYQLKSTIVIVVFVLICAISIIAAQMTTPRLKQIHQIETKAQDKKSQFKNIFYYSLNRSVPNMEFVATDLSIINQSVLYFQSPTGRIKRGAQEAENYLNYKAGAGNYNAVKGVLHLKQEVTVDYGNSLLISRDLSFYKNKNLLVGSGGVESKFVDMKTGDQIFINANKVEANPKLEFSKFVGEVKGNIKRKRAYQEPMNFLADNLGISLIEGKVDMKGNVLLEKPNFKVLAKNAEIFLDNFNKKLKYYQLTDDIKMQERVQKRNGEFFERKAFAERMEGYASEGKLVLTGAPRVLQGRDIIKGTKIVLRQDVELVEVDDSNTRFTLEKK
jgi:lipopolysaccharide export system protein LptA